MIPAAPTLQVPSRLSPLIWPTRAAPASYPSAQTRLHALRLTRFIHKLGAWAERLGRRDLSGAYAVSGLMFLIAGVLIFAALRPDPRQVGKAVSALYPPAIKTTDGVRSLRVILGGSDARLAMIAMVLGQAVMVMVTLRMG